MQKFTSQFKQKRTLLLFESLISNRIGREEKRLKVRTFC